MKTLYHISFLLLSNLAVAQLGSEQIQRPKTNLKDFSLVGKIKKIKTSAVDAYHRYATGFLDTEYFNAVGYEFDRNGNMVSRANYLEYGKRLGLYSQETFVYNATNRLIEYSQTIIQNGEEPSRVQDYKLYQYKGDQLLSERYTRSTKTNTTQFQSTFRYDEDLEQITDWVNGVKSNEVNFSYNSNHQLVKTELINFNGSKGLIEYLISDEKGRTIGIEKNIQNRKTYAFAEYGSNSLTLRTTDEAMNVIREGVYRNQELVSLKKKNKESDATLAHFTFEYDYDHYGNWTRCVVSQNGRLVQTLTRQIAYYE
ncbi:hypothetical protein ACF3NR_06995 [Vaginella massiliensis]|uniref:hypothetical protein n=1 Tax=Vaginella massiliensis TaxID=1816680 RepID=UPI003750C711